MILENGNTTCVGKIRSPDEYTLSVQHLIEEIPKNETFETEIEMNDIYKDLRIMGYDHGPKFRGLHRIKTNNFETFRGEVEWDGKWVPFMDSLLQTLATAMPFRKMMVPVMIKQLRCDPKALFEAVEANRVDYKNQEFPDDVNISEEMKKEMNTESDIKIFLDPNDIDPKVAFREMYHIYKSKIPFYVNMTSRMIVAPGIEVEDIMALPIPRKVNIQDLKLESYEFIANEEYNSIEESDKKGLLEYLKVCSLFSSLN